jgi:hypothetical protein
MRLWSLYRSLALVILRHLSEFCGKDGRLFLVVPTWPRLLNRARPRARARFENVSLTVSSA